MAPLPIPAANSQAVNTGGGVPSFIAVWWNFFNSLLAYVTTGPIGPVPLVGVIDGSVAAAGNVGEYLKSIRTVAAGVSIVSITNTQITSLVLTAGDWILWGEVNFGRPTGGAATLDYVSASLFTTTAANPTTSQYPADGADFVELSLRNVNNGASVYLGPMTINITTNTTFFLNASAEFSATTLLVGGALRARRMR